MRSLPVWGWRELVRGGADEELYYIMEGLFFIAKQQPAKLHTESKLSDNNSLQVKFKSVYKDR